MAIFSGAQMVALGIVGEYIARIHSENMGRPTYVISDRTDQFMREDGARDGI